MPARCRPGVGGNGDAFAGRCEGHTGHGATFWDRVWEKFASAQGIGSVCMFRSSKQHHGQPSRVVVRSRVHCSLKQRQAVFITPEPRVRSTPRYVGGSRAPGRGCKTVRIGEIDFAKLQTAPAIQTGVFTKIGSCYACAVMHWVSQKKKHPPTPLEGGRRGSPL